MAAREHFVAGGLHQIEALWLPADAGKGGFQTGRWFFQLLSAETAVGCVLLVTGLPDVVRLFAALGAEVLSASVASNSVVCHVLGCLGRDWLAFVVLLALNHVSWHLLHYVSTGALYEVWIKFDDTHLLVFLNCLLLFFT